MRTSPIEIEQQLANASPLRRDLRSVLVQGKSRIDRIIVDEIGGRFARVSEHLWQRLQRGDVDASLWNEARSAGWTRDRDLRTRSGFNPLAIRVSVGSLDWIAARITRWSGVMFSAPAAISWATLIVVMFVLVACRADEVSATLGSLNRFFAQSGPLLISAVFVLTKLVHEIAHAVMCRRIGSRVGSFGVLFLCGMPCPYCDVTDIWRQPSAAKRIAVMLAGIYVELIVAALASIVWLYALDPTIRLLALNVMIVCSVSTLVFNANPLMRYDGYYALSDLVGSTNLRREARSMFAAVVTSRVAGRRFGIVRRSDSRAIGLAFYHFASVIYRVMVWLAIATFLIYVAQMFGVRSIAVAVVMFVFAMMVARFGKQAMSMLRGVGHWDQVPKVRRGFVLSIMVALLLAGLFTPLPRFRRASGLVDAAFASTVYFSSSGMVDAVFADYGDRVAQGQSLVHLRSDTLSIEEARLSGQWNVARLRSSLSRRSNLGESRYTSSSRQPSLPHDDARTSYDSASQWPALQAAEEAVAVRLASSRKRVMETKVKALVPGIVIPVAPSNLETASAKPVTTSLRDLQGRAVEIQTPWCRVSSDGKLYAVLAIDARDRQMIDVGSPVKICFTKNPHEIIASSVASVSEIRLEGPTVFREAVFQVICPLPAQKSDRLLSLLGAECHGVFPLAKKPLADHIKERFNDWIRG